MGIYISHFASVSISLYNMDMLFSSKQKTELALLLDVQSSIVRGSLVNLKSKSNPIFIFTHAVPIPFKQDVNSGYLVKVTLRAINEVVETVLKELSVRNSSGVIQDLPSKINHVHFILSSPWIVSQAKTLKLSFPKYTKVTPDKLRPYLEEERNKLTGDDADHLAVIEEKVFDVRLNGYSIPNWQNKIIKDLEVSFVISVAGTKLIKSFSGIANKAVPMNKIFFHSCLLLQNMGIQKILKTRADYSLIHIHGEITDVVVINKHSCTFFGSYPLGINSIIRKISLATKTNIQAAESLLTLFMNSQLDPAHSDSTQKSVSQISQEWMTDLLKLLNNTHVPVSSLDEVIISAHSHDQYFLQIFQKLKPQSTITLLSIEDVKSHVDFILQTEKLRIMGLCATAIHNK